MRPSEPEPKIPFTQRFHGAIIVGTTVTVLSTLIGAWIVRTEWSGVPQAVRLAFANLTPSNDLKPLLYLDGSSETPPRAATRLRNETGEKVEVFLQRLPGGRPGRRALEMILIGKEVCLDASWRFNAELWTTTKAGATSADFHSNYPLATGSVWSIVFDRTNQVFELALASGSGAAPCTAADSLIQ